MAQGANAGGRKAAAAAAGSRGSGSDGPQVSAELVRGTIGPVVLTLLKDGPRYGYDMVRTVNARTRGALEWTEGALDPVLHKLEDDGLIAAEWRDVPTGERGGKRRRRYYSLTASGRRDLARRSAEWKSFAQAMGEFFASAIAAPGTR